MKDERARAKAQRRKERSDGWEVGLIDLLRALQAPYITGSGSPSDPDQIREILQSVL